MNRTYDKFQVVLLSEVKGKDSNAFIFELRLTSDDNCRIRIIDFDAFDIDGNKYSAGQEKISTTDVILGHSRFFTETKKINIKISAQFKARIGCMAVLTAACIEDRQQMRFCFQRKGTNRWDCVGVEFMEYEGLTMPEEEVEIIEAEETVIEQQEVKECIAESVSETDLQENALSEAVKEADTESEECAVLDLEEELKKDSYDELLSLTMKDFTMRYGLENTTVDEVLQKLQVCIAQNDGIKIQQPVLCEEQSEISEEQEQTIEDYLNSLIEFDEKSSETIGLAVKNMKIRAGETGGDVTPVLYCEVSYSKETYVLVRCPMIKVIFYDAKGSIDSVAMHSVSRIHTGEDIVEMAFKKSTLKYWKNKSKIKVLVTI